MCIQVGGTIEEMRKKQQLTQFLLFFTMSSSKRKATLKHNVIIQSKEGLRVNLTKTEDSKAYRRKEIPEESNPPATGMATPEASPCSDYEETLVS
nr:hypothetical protein Iba_chr10dCG9790 [Ipomoea batatas]